MPAHKWKNLTICLLGSFILAGIPMVIWDICCVWLGREMRCAVFLAGMAALTILFSWIFWKQKKNALKTVAAVFLSLSLLTLTVFLGWRYFSKTSAFENLDQGKAQLYAGHRVMLIVPHEDDDINVLGGVMEAYVRYGSELYPVFVTNGDYMVPSEQRLAEALDAMTRIGVPEEQVIFLGYGDTWKEGGPHLYNAEPGVTVESAAGYTATYGMKTHGAYREGRAYTSDHLLEDMHDVIVAYQADVIFCVDYDTHMDHRATTLAFEKVMGKILKENPDYRPLVFKGYAYPTAWYAPADFCAPNILSTQDTISGNDSWIPGIYRWEERVRLPVLDETLSRSLFSSKIYETMACYASQHAVCNAPSVINGDKVFWYRDTNSLCYQADIQVSSGNGELLNDFMLLEYNDLMKASRLPTDGTWVPEDAEKTATVTFREPVDVAEIRLYDNPSPEDNVLSGTIQFPDGSQIPFGPLNPVGACVTIPVDKTGITGFCVILTETEGERAGLTELEAFSKQPDHGLRMVKLMDGDGNFLYDYWLPETGKDTLSVYTLGLTDAQRAHLTLSWDNQKCWAKLENGSIEMICPKGETMTLTIRLDGSDLSDTIRIHNPGKLTRIYYGMCQYLEDYTLQIYDHILYLYAEGYYKKSAVYKLTATLLDMVGIPITDIL